ncbi:hypothetical protein SAMN04487893_101182 [Myroides guanonis]|uniref:Uncharacterized protein n=1 Tax=Myroides guanonis TaxID=1150112 RepID=A0A1I3L5A9_9FLAO|nr:hypothetical protein SAMN04487893_101182 [Myroides guanonis]
MRDYFIDRFIKIMRYIQYYNIDIIQIDLNVTSPIKYRTHYNINIV